MMVTVVAEASVPKEKRSARFANVVETQTPLLFEAKYQSRLKGIFLKPAPPRYPCR
jgi:hypothetical protein